MRDYKVELRVRVKQKKINHPSIYLIVWVPHVLSTLCIKFKQFLWVAVLSTAVFSGIDAKYKVHMSKSNVKFDEKLSEAIVNIL